MSDREGENEEAAIGICEILGNLPLAIEVAGKYLDMMAPDFLSLEDYLVKLKEAGAIGHRSFNKDEELEPTCHTTNLLATLKVNKDISKDQNIKRLLVKIVAFPTDEIIDPMLLAKIYKLDWDDEKEIIVESLITLDEYSIIKIMDNNYKHFTIHSLLKEALEKQLPENEVEESKEIYNNFIDNKKEATEVFGEWFCEFWSGKHGKKEAYKMTSPSIFEVIEAVQFAIKHKMYPNSFELCLALGRYFKFTVKYEKALYWFEMSEKLTNDYEPYNQSNLFLAYFYIGEIYYFLGKYKKAVSYTEKALEISKENYGKKHQNTAHCLNDLGLVLSYLKEYQKATSYYQQALGIWKETDGEKHPKVATCLNNLGAVRYFQGEYQKAIEYYEQALDIEKKFYGEKEPRVATNLNNLGFAWNFLGECQKAIRYSEQALRIDKEFYGEKHPDVARDLSGLGCAWSRLGEHQKAIYYFEQAHNIYSEILGPDHPKTKEIKNNLEICKKNSLETRESKRGERVVYIHVDGHEEMHRKWSRKCTFFDDLFRSS